MIIRNITGDVTAPIKGIIGHGVNCQGVMGSGVALAIRNKFPKAYQEYLQLCSEKKPEELLGTTQLVQISDDLYVANMFTQLKFGHDGKVYASLDAIRSACLDLVDMREEMILDRQQPNIHAMVEAMMEIIDRGMLSPRQHYFPDAPFFAEGDSAVGDRRRKMMLSHLREIAIGMQNTFKTDDVDQCIYDLEIFLPRIGAGLGGLEWDDVKKTIDTYTGPAPVSIYTL